MEVPARRRRLAKRGNELLVDVVDLDRREAAPLEARRCAGLAHEPRQAVAGGAVAAEVDAGEHDLAMTLHDAAADLAEDRLGRAAPRFSAHERNDAEAARERASVLNLDEGTDA